MSEKQTYIMPNGGLLTAIVENNSGAVTVRYAESIKILDIGAALTVSYQQPPMFGKNAVYHVDCWWRGENSDDVITAKLVITFNHHNHLYFIGDEFTEEQNFAIRYIGRMLRNNNPQSDMDDDLEF